MKYLKMLQMVSVGEVCFRISEKHMVVYRKGDTIIRAYADEQEFIFVASLKEMEADDWEVLSHNVEPIIYCPNIPNLLIEAKKKYELQRSHERMF